MPKIKKPANQHPIPNNPVNNNQPLALINFILDKSGSMSSIKEATISGFNEYKNDQANQPGNTFLSLTTFDTSFNIIHSAEDIHKVTDLDTGNYVPGGMTALYDAIGFTLEKLEENIKKLPRTPDSVLFVIMTDGEENSSREYDKDKIKKLIEESEKDKGYTFVYLGANQDAWNVGASFGIRAGNTLSYNADSDDVSKVMCSLSSATTRYRDAYTNLDSDVDKNLVSQNFWADDEDVKKEDKKD